MTDAIQSYPELAPFLDQTDDFAVRVEDLVIDGQSYLLVTQTSEFEGDQLLLRRDAAGLTLVADDTVLTLSRFGGAGSLKLNLAPAGPASAADHALLHAHQKSKVGVFSSATGPDGGNLACVWAVRHLAYQALNRWITRTDGTAVFAPELRQKLGGPVPEADLLPGGIVISPTKTLNSGARNVGHVGFVGEGSGGPRLIYSNSSSAALWKQNFTVQSWIDRYQTRKGLPVHFYPLPA